jgi:hypothetical protein
MDADGGPTLEEAMLSGARNGWVTVLQSLRHVRQDVMTGGRLNPHQARVVADLCVLLEERAGARAIEDEYSAMTLPELARAVLERQREQFGAGA